MEQIMHLIEDIISLKRLLTTDDILTRAVGAKTTFVQIYTSINEETWLQSVSGEIRKALPSAVIVGATTSGEIFHGASYTEKTLIAFSFFRTSCVEPIAFLCPAKEEREVGSRISQIIGKYNNIAGVMLLATAINIDSESLLRELSELPLDYPIFGAGAGFYQVPNQTLILCDSTVFSQGVVAVVFFGPELHIESIAYLGWKAFSKEMTITETDGLTVKTVDNEPAVTIYQRYLDIAADDFFAIHAVGFSFLLKRNNEYIARVPIGVTEEGGVVFASDVHCGETFRIGYADPVMIIEQAKQMHARLQQFRPDAIFLFLCGARRYLLQDDVQQETMPFEKIAPTLGFFTAGEYFGRGQQLQMLNSTLLAVGLREGQLFQSHNSAVETDSEINPADNQNFFNYKDTRIISRLIHFIEAVTAELDQANKELAQLAIIDKLTQVYNRVKTDEVLKMEVSRSERYDSVFSIILFDIDCFKNINDTYGHLIGDKILIEIAGIINSIVGRESDVAGRWGGDEFLIILHGTGIDQAELLAEKLCTFIAGHKFTADIQATISLGVVTYRHGDTEESMLIRADNALYEAKHRGQNQAVIIQN